MMRPFLPAISQLLALSPFVILAVLIFSTPVQATLTLKLSKYETGTSLIVQSLLITGNSTSSGVVDAAIERAVSHPITNGARKRNTPSGTRPTRRQTYSSSSVLSSTTSVDAAAQSSSTGESTYDLSNNGATYTVDIEVGGVTLPVVVDTGSANLWVASSICSDCGTMTTVPLSSSCPSPQQITYGSGAVEGCFANTTVVLGTYTLNSCSVLGITEVNSFYTAESEWYSGIWGIGLASLSEYNQPTVVNTLYNAGELVSPLVGFYLPSSGDGELTVGDQSTNTHADTSKMVQLTNSDLSLGFYSVSMDAVVANGVSVEGTTNISVIFDTGTTDIIFPFEALGPIYAAIGVNTSYSTYDPTDGTSYLLPCTQPSTFTSLAFSFGGMQFDVTYSDLVGSAVDGSTDLCYGNIYNMTSLGSYWLVGDLFLRNVYHAVNTETGDVTLYGLLD